MTEREEKKEEDKGFKVVDKRPFHLDEKGGVVPGGNAPETGAAPGDRRAEEPPAGAGDRRDAPGTARPASGPNAPPREEMTFTHLVLSLSASAYMSLEKDKNLDNARQTIDVLGILQEKTAGNLSKDEDNLLKNVLYDLRMKFVDAGKKS